MIDLDNETAVSKVKITKVGFVRRMPDGNPLIHGWHFTHIATEEGEDFTPKQLRKISEDFYGDMLESYERESPYGLWYR